MPIPQERLITLARAGKFFLDKVKIIRAEAQRMLELDHTNELARVVLEIINDGNLIEESAAILTEIRIFNPQRIKHNQKSAIRQRNSRTKQPAAPFRYNAISNIVTGDVGPAKDFFETAGIKVESKPEDEYDAIAKKYNLKGFTDTLANVPKDEDDLFREPGENETDTE